MTDNTLTKTIFCQNSGVALAQLEIRIFEGHLAYLEAHSDALYLHPFYRVSSSVLLKKFEDCLHHSQEQAWVLTHAEQQRLQLLTSAMMHSLGCIKQDRPTLPPFPIAAASSGRLLGLAKWFWFISSQRLEFPIYSISGKNDNLDWSNFKHWLDSAYLVREDWASKSRKLQIDAQKRAHEQSMREIKSESYRRVDTKKVWNWIHLQLADEYAPGRLETFKNLFLNGDLDISNWILDDVEDLKIALVQHCDCGNEIMHFINKRLDGIAGLIKDFYSSFTILGQKSSPEASFGDDEQTLQEQQFIAEFDTRVAALESLPPAPQRADYQTLGLFLKAQAQWNILSKRFKLLKGNQS